MEATKSTQQFQFPVRSTWRMPCKHWIQFPIRRTLVKFSDNFCDKCRVKLPAYDIEDKNLQYQHEKQFYDFMHQHPKSKPFVCEP